MSMLGTDVMAVACILGGAAVSGGVTLAALVGLHGHEAPCAVEALALAPDVVLSGGDGVHTIVVSPWLPGLRGCDTEVMERVRVRVDTRLQMDPRAEIHARIQREMQRARAEMERAQVQVERALAQAEREGRVIIR